MTDINNITPSAQDTKKEVPIKLLATTIIMAVVLVFLVVMYFYQRHNMVEMETILTQEKDSLTNELQLMVVAYDTLRTNNDSLNAGLEKERERIVQLLAINASIGTSFTPNNTSQSETSLTILRPFLAYKSSEKKRTSELSTSIVKSAYLFCNSSHASGEKTTRLSGGFFLSLMIAIFINI